MIIVPIWAVVALCAMSAVLPIVFNVRYRDGTFLPATVAFGYMAVIEAIVGLGLAGSDEEMIRLFYLRWGIVLFALTFMISAYIYSRRFK